MKEALIAQPQVKVLFLSRPDPRIDALGQAFPGRVDRQWVRPAEVAAILAECDHGILVREDSITNRVASPTKFAEYLRAGLKVVAPEHLGDVSARVEREDLGCVWRPGLPLAPFKRVSPEDRRRLEQLALTTLTKRRVRWRVPPSVGGAAVSSKTLRHRTIASGFIRPSLASGKTIATFYCDSG
ncbi:MAG: hypothetical protein IPL81_06110 [Flavobacteriales bacterium]|nr:hypothetical protein [Flavobacteriales bacterium]